MVTNTQAKKKMTTKRKASAVLAAVLIVALLMGGAFAWTDFGQNITNRFRGAADPDVLLHDDFEQNVNKDVYVENTGSVDTLVRVQFAEYFQIGNRVMVGGNQEDKSTWKVHKFEGANPENCGLSPHDYFKWEMTGNAKVYKPGTGDMGNFDYTLGEVFEDGTVAKDTLPTNAPISIDEYVANMAMYDAEPTGRWILDKDGWGYWSKLLKPGEATNLLLDNASLIAGMTPDDNYAYFIDVRLHASNVTESSELYDGSKEGSTATTEAEKHIIDRLSGIYTDQNGDKYRDTDDPNVLEKLDPNGKPLIPPVFIIDPDKSIKDQGELSGDETEVIKGVDDNFYIDNGDGSYTSTWGITITPGADGKVGNGDDHLVSVQPKPVNPSTPLQFRILTIGNLVVGESHTIRLVDLTGKPLKNSDFSFITDNEEAISITKDGVLTLKKEASNPTVAARAADGSYQIATVNVRAGVEAINKFTGFYAYTVEEKHTAALVNKKVDVMTRVLSDVLYNNAYGNATAVEYAIEGNALGCTVPKTVGLLTTGSQTGTVKVKVTVTAQNRLSTALPAATWGAEIAPGAFYTKVGYVTVNIEDSLVEGGTLATSYSGDWAGAQPASKYQSGDGSRTYPFEIASVNQMKKLDMDIASAGATNATYQKFFKLSTDLDFAGTTFSGEFIGRFEGNFNGGNKVIRNLDKSIFTNLFYATVQNLGRVGGTITGTGYLGSFAGVLGNEAKLINCYNTSNLILSKMNGGGLVSTLSEGGSIINCYNAGNISGEKHIGGLVGYIVGSNNIIEDSYNTGTVKATVAGAGGILGLSHLEQRSTTIRNTKNYGNVLSPLNAGSITGRIDNPASLTTLTFENVQSKRGVVSIDNGVTFLNDKFYGSAVPANLTIIGTPTEVAGLTAP